ncbi:restriction endonuclease subunit S [Pectobacterium versatile]|uniref:restriction endonuclease subunit S n=1 Tax=Pectobacterium versatile TaxID=2488639 RepID=UPI00102EDA88|nr:restriction endonuclease subunit S [Pectobacterium versatile]MBA0182327.1 restriction endonuclease subunit S [Pectobacterium versatile]TAJ04574.1 restriction endonuclease subunit S [Pectobacterium versatile]
MTVETLITDHIDIWSSALQTRSTAGRGSNGKIDLYGIKKLRELILELAVRGKLVPQDPNDEPASELLKRIAAEKAELVKQGKIKKQKPLPEISEDEKPFELPEGWEWARLNDISKYIQRGKGPKYAEHGSVKVVSQKCVQWSGFKLEQSRWITDESIHSYTEERFLKDGDVLWNSTGAGGTAGRVIYLPVVKEKLVVDSHVTLIRTVRGNGQFISNYISTYGIQQRFDPKHSNTLLSGTTNQAELNSSVVTSFLVPFPPQKEQERINDKAAELMSLCDQLEQQSLISLDAHQQLVETLLATLFDSQHAEEFAENWARISQHFDTLFTTEASIDALKQTILQLAVMGKLVPQDPNDEPASGLLKRIDQEKAQLVKEGKIKKHPPVEPLGEPALLPRSWLNIVVQDFADIRLGSTPDRSEKKYWNGDIPWVSSGEVANEVILDTKEKITPEGFKNSSTSMIPTGSLLMAIIGQGKTRGQTAILGIDACTNQNVAAFVFNQVLVEPEYVWIWAKSKYLSHRGDGHGGAQPALNGKKVRSFIFPLAPIKEQQRIVSEVKRLNDICDTLQSRLQSAQQTQRHLADALTDAALN